MLIIGTNGSKCYRTLTVHHQMRTKEVSFKADKFVGNNLITNSLAKTNSGLYVWIVVDLESRSRTRLTRRGPSHTFRSWFRRRTSSRLGCAIRELASDLDLGETTTGSTSRFYSAPSSESSESRCRLLQPEDLQLAAVAVGLNGSGS